VHAVYSNNVILSLDTFHIFQKKVQVRHRAYLVDHQIRILGSKLMERIVIELSSNNAIVL